MYTDYTCHSLSLQLYLTPSSCCVPKSKGKTKHVLLFTWVERHLKGDKACDCLHSTLRIDRGQRLHFFSTLILCFTYIVFIIISFGEIFSPNKYLNDYKTWKMTENSHGFGDSVCINCLFFSFCKWQRLISNSKITEIWSVFLLCPTNTNTPNQIV